jgi:hypothetical protein
LKERSFADQLSNVVGDAQARALDCLGSHITGYGSEAEASIELSGNRSRRTTHRDPKLLLHEHCLIIGVAPGF